MATMQTDTLHTEPSSRHSHTLVASDRVEGTPVRRANGEKIGTIQRLMIDKLSGSVAYADSQLLPGTSLLGRVLAATLRSVAKQRRHAGHGRRSPAKRSGGGQDSAE
jgi:hypothetical protein